MDNALILAGTQADPVNGIAEIQSLSITDGATQIGGINAANANFTGTDGLVGIDAPNVVVGVFLFVGGHHPFGDRDAGASGERGFDAGGPLHHRWRSR